MGWISIPQELARARAETVSSAIPTGVTLRIFLPPAEKGPDQTSKFDAITSWFVPPPRMSARRPQRRIDARHRSHQCCPAPTPRQRVSFGRDTNRRPRHLPETAQTNLAQLDHINAAFQTTGPQWQRIVRGDTFKKRIGISWTWRFRTATPRFPSPPPR